MLATTDKRLDGRQCYRGVVALVRAVLRPDVRIEYRINRSKLST